MPPFSSPTLFPTIGVLVGGIISGLTWLPLREIERAGIAGLWIALSVVVVACVPVLLALVGARVRSRDLVSLFWIAALIGIAYPFYTASLTTTQVARAILLFYISPVWGALLEVFVLRQPLTRRRATALALGAAGLVAILGIGSNPSVTINLGDVLALLSGILWSVGLLFVFGRAGPSVAVQCAALAVGALLGAVAMVVFLEPTPLPDLEVVERAAPWILVTGLAFIFPVWILSLWGGRSVSPARTTLIFMAEVSVGIGSAALWASQGFGVRETIGTVLVLAAAAVEFGGARSGQALQAQDAPPA